MKPFRQLLVVVFTRRLKITTVPVEITKLNDLGYPKLNLDLKSIRAYITALPLRFTLRFTSWTKSRLEPALTARAKNGDSTNGYAFAEPPMRSELFSAEQMERHGKVLAELHKLSETRSSDRLLPRLVENYDVLVWACGILTAAVKANQRVTPAGEWLIDNFYLIEEQIRTAKRHFSKKYSQELPGLATGSSAGLPRVYDIALEAISHGDGRIDPESLDRFVAAYQKSSDLKLGELWAIPIMLRLALLENLRRVAARVAVGMIDRNIADTWADKMIKTAEDDPKSLILVIADMARSDPPMVNSFVAELARRLQGHSSALAIPLTWIEQRLSETGTTVEQLVQSETQSQAANQVSISNSIGSLRFLGATDWRKFVEGMSSVEQKLREDPDGVYSRMDFSTRDRYRHVIEDIAKRSKLNEYDVSRKAIQLAFVGKTQQSKGNTSGNNEDGKREINLHAAHVGFYLIDDGRKQLEHAVEAHVTFVEALRRFDRLSEHFPLLLYVGSISVLTLVFVLALLSADEIKQFFAWSPDVLVIIAITSVAATLGASQLAVTVTNWLATLLASPLLLPRMDFSMAIPPEARTLVVVPSMLTTRQNVEDLIEALEVRFLANRIDNLHFALLTDFPDAAQQNTDTDKPLLALAIARIQALNNKYGSVDNDSDTFFLFHRPRKWNPSEFIWMGHERKRGKLGDLNTLLRTGNQDAFESVIGNTERLGEIRFVITLDTDTQLPRDSAREMIATMAHPLNRSQYANAVGDTKKRVIHGYGILQPRIAVSLPSTNRSRFAQLYGGELGIDPYTRAVSDVYQDVFDEGSFVGKGIYDVDAFEYSLNGQFPENRILSHDLLEGCYARAGLLSDVLLYDDYPSRYSADASRRHRWIRGDWQIAAWLLARVPGPGHKKLKNPLSKLSQWKIFDNLRRSLVPLGMVLLLVMGWFVVPSTACWTLSVIGAALVPIVLSSALDLVRKPTDVLFRQHLWRVIYSVGRQLAQALFSLTCLVHEAWFSLDAILRTAMRMLFTKKRLLEWNPSGEFERNVVSAVNLENNASDPGYIGNASDIGSSNTRGTSQTGAEAELFSDVRAMWISPAIAAMISIYLSTQRPTALVAAMPVLLLWFIAPLAAWQMSQPLVHRKPQLQPAQLVFLRHLARKTWRYFEQFITANDHWLPPDNYQEHPVAIIAHRTSPTNIGLALLANLSAYDFGYITAGKLLERTENTFDSMQTLERYQGHFYNWYDTLSMMPLQPLYVSTVDSGNLSGHLLTLRPGLLALIDAPIFGATLFEGLCDTLSNLVESASKSSGKNSSKNFEKNVPTSAVKTSPYPHHTQNLARLKHDIESACDQRPGTITALKRQLERITNSAKKVMKIDASVAPGATLTSALEGAENANEVEFDWWAQSLHRQCQDALDELVFLMPWCALDIGPKLLSDVGSEVRGTDARNAARGKLRTFLCLDTIPKLREIAKIDAAWWAMSDDERAQLQGEINEKLKSKFDRTFAGKLEANSKNSDETNASTGASDPDHREGFDNLSGLAALVRLGSERADARVTSIAALAQQAEALATVEYDFLYDSAQKLMAVGYNVEQSRIDTGRYDLLASEARLASFVAIAQGKIPQESWFALGRNLASSGGEAILLSWSGSMFEYLMPNLVMPTYENTLLDQTCAAAVKRQIAYGNLHDVPWGVSESGYNTVDAGLNYQYRAFGVPGLGLKRGLAEDLVIAPYASALALMVMPEAACQNLQRLVADGFVGEFGMYEAIDYTASRVPRGQTQAVIRSFMVHHQGMTMLSLAHVLLNQPMQRRFETDRKFQATVLLLQEKIPTTSAQHIHAPELPEVRTPSVDLAAPLRVLRTPDTLAPEVLLLSNGRYQVMVTNAGGGYSRWKEFAVTRWREDSTRDNWGTFAFIRDVASGDFWSTAHQPTLKQADSYESIFSEGRAEFRRGDHGDNYAYETHTEIVVSPEDDIELRRTHITNRSRARRIIEITSYAEIILGPAAADTLHPAFSNLFVQTEIIADRQTIISTRRPRASGEQVPWMFHLMAVHGAEVVGISYETDRARFIGRTRSINFPHAMLTTSGTGALSNTDGAVLDPIVSIRYRIKLDAQQTATIDIVSGVSETRDGTMSLASKYRDRHLADRVFDLAWTHSTVNLRQINATESDAQIYGRLAGAIIYANAELRASANIQIRNRRGQSSLWGYAISGDLPIVLLQISDISNIELVRQMVQAHAYWRLKGLAVDLVIWNEDHVGYRQLLQEKIMGLIAGGIEAHLTDRPGGIFVRVAEQISNEDRILLQTVARVIISDTRGTLSAQTRRRNAKGKESTKWESELLHPAALNAIGRPNATPPIIARSLPALKVGEKLSTIARLIAPDTPESNVERAPSLSPDLQFVNGTGGFSTDGREYVIVTSTQSPTPAPWSNVMANAQFGTVISESGSAYTWSENAHEFRLTPWGNDSISDGSGEAIYIRDEETGLFWSPTQLPSGNAAPYITRHGFGYSVFEHEEGGIRTELTVHVDLSAPVKFSVLKISNHSGRTRRLSATGYVEWVMGDIREKSAMHILTEIDPASGALCARNPYSAEFADRVAFFDAGDSTGSANVSVSGDRSEFLGRNGAPSNPASMSRVKLSNKVGAGLDPCGAIQVPFELANGQEREITFRLGLAERNGIDGAVTTLLNLRGANAARESLQAVRDYWETTLSAVQVETPDASLNTLANGWLLYQTLACRLWAKSGNYQSGGAFGFRDQLQDTMALVYAEPRLFREHLLRAASRQFLEGDVQHWWHPPAGRGVRTHCSDDYLWLAQAVCRYVQLTGDTGVLNESIHFLEGRPVNAEDDSYYDLPILSDTKAPLYQHCVRAILRGLRFGVHGLPLMGSGDWNDGMNLVGIQGKGESVWLGFFLYDTLVQFGELATRHGDADFANRCGVEADQLKRQLDQHGWDGAWYRRAYLDDGRALGSALNTECQIDSIAQSWAVLSGGGDSGRARMAMNALDERLVKREDALIQLLAPPFDKSDLNPGYIKGYVPGVRENGGQYTHAAIWAGMAFAKLGDSKRAWELFTMINPINHARSAASVATYKVEPYVIAADVYAVPPHTGRGGWTWYTGSAGWMYRFLLESILGLTVEANKLQFQPCVPAEWKGFKIRYRYRETVYAIAVTVVNDGAPEVGIDQKTKPQTTSSTVVTIDGIAQRDSVILMQDDRVEHQVEVHIQVQ